MAAMVVARGGATLRAVPPPTTIETPVGPLAVGRRDGRLAIEWLVPGAPHPGPADDSETRALRTALAAFFARRDPAAFDAIPTGAGTPFMQRVWNACRTIPFGETRTYGWIAAEIGASAVAARAVGQALRRNPLPLVVPCHRVVPVAGLGGYAGDTSGPLAEIKRRLLEFERNAVVGASIG
jgi:methylated-DNA-[protein]-cysteine S-methyltransferase